MLCLTFSMCLKHQILSKFFYLVHHSAKKRCRNQLKVTQIFGSTYWDHTQEINCLLPLRDLPLRLNSTVASSTDRHKRFAVTYESGAPFVFAMKTSPPIMKQNGWFFCDGLMDKRKHGIGIQFIPGDPKTPHTYRLSHVIYLKDC